MTVKTKEIKIPNSQFFGILFQEYGLKWIGIIGGIAILLGGMSLIYDYRWVVIALIWIFIISPFTFLFIFITYGMLPVTTCNVVKHTLSFEDSSLKIDILPDENNLKQSSVRKIEYTLFQRYKYGTGYIILYFESPMKGWIWLPFDSLENKDDVSKIIEMISHSRIYNQM